jgi:NTP pyrophosphatase (non-canonical NTP hydrolase)
MQGARRKSRAREPLSPPRDTLTSMTDAARDALRAFVAERDWAQFHTPENLAKSISIEAAELLEVFQWNGDADEQRLRDELADVLSYCILLADRIGADPQQLVLDKLEQTRAKYPADKARGRSEKYDQL